MEKMKWIKKGISALLALNMVLSSVPLPAFAVTEDNLCEHHPVHTAECHYAEAVAGSPCTHEHSEDCYAILACLHTCGDECEDPCTHECTVESGCITMELDCHHTHGDCGYSEGTAEVPCGHVHNESCGYAEAVAGNPCANAETDPECDHTGDCGFVAVVEGQPCGHTEHTDCGYAPATEGTPCTHTHAVKVDSADSCYKLLCSHKDGGHDDACGYAQAVEAHECHYECAECVAALTADETTAPSTEATTEPSTEATEPAPVCDCGTDDAAIHATTCAVYAAPENPVCYCTEKCTEVNEWCDVCGFDYTKCGGTDSAVAYADGITVTIDTGEEVILQDSDADDYYEIGNADELYAFAAAVNGGNNAINGELTANIVVNQNVLVDGALNSNTEGFRVWTPIGYYTSAEDKVDYVGIFDGGGHTVSGLYFNDSTIYRIGLFGAVSTNGIVKNVGVVDSYFCGLQRVGGVVGYNYEGGTVQNCYNMGAVSGDDYVGGVVGYNYEEGAVQNCYNRGTVSSSNTAGGVVSQNWGGFVTNCYNTGTVNGGNETGGVVGFVISASVEHCYNTGDVSGSNYVGGIFGYGSGGNAKNCYNTGTVSGSKHVGGVVGYLLSGTVENCYNANSVSGTQNVGGVIGARYSSSIVTNSYFDSTKHSGNAFGLNEGTTEADVGGKTSEQFASGEVAYQLGSAFGQNIDNGKPVQTLPVLSGAAVYSIQNCKNETLYSNTNENIGHQWENGTCTVCSEACAHSDSNHETATDKGDGTHSFTCTVCGETATEDHSFTDGTCTVCGYVCPHSGFDSTTGICGDCDTSVAIAKVETGETTTYYQAAAELRTAVEANTAAQTVTLLADFAIEQLCFDDAGTKNTLDLNGHNLTCHNPYMMLIIAQSCELTITGTGSIDFANHGLMNVYGVDAKITVGGDVALDGILCNTDGNVIDLTCATIPDAGLTVELRIYDLLDDPPTYNVSDVLLLPADYYLFVDGKAVYSYSSNAVGTVLKHTEHSYSYSDNGDGTHDKVCTACGKVEVDNEKHTPNADGYTINNNGTHSFTCTVCGPVTESHTFTDGTCTGCGIMGGYCGGEGDGTNLMWTLVDGKLTITGTGAMADYARYYDSPWYNNRDNITALSISEGVTTIGKNAFHSITGLKSVTIPASVTKLGEVAFADSGLESVTFAEGSQLTTIGSHAFQLCTALKQVTIPASVTSMDAPAAFGSCSNLESIRVESGSTTYKDIDGVLYTADGKTLLYYPTGKSAEAFTTPDGVTTIGESAFDDNMYLRTVTLSEGVTTINAGAFPCEALETIHLPDSLITIGDWAFYCPALTEVTIPKNVTSIGEGAFSDCEALTTVTIPASVNSIGTDAFYDCLSLTTVNAPCNWDGSLYTFDATVTVNKAEHTPDADSYTDNGDGTHDAACADCGAVVVDNEAHSTTADGDRAATCAALAYCSVCESYYGEVDKTNHDSTIAYVNGFCENGCYEPAIDSDSDGYYEIGNAGKLFWFAQQINVEGNREIKGVLTADINLENRPWTPIGSTGEDSNNFRGVFDGQNHTIKGLYVEGSRAGLGFFGEVRTGTVKNFTIYGEVVVNTEVDYVGGVIGSACGLNGDNDLYRNGAIIQNITSYVNLTAKAHGIGRIGGFVGYANHQSLIENCSWYGTFDAGIYRVDSGAGGFVGRIQENSSEVTIRNCAAYGTIKTNYAKNSYNSTATIYMGGFLSLSHTDAKTTLENCLFAGKFERGENLTDEARLGAFGTLTSVESIKNCYYLGDDGLADVHSDSPLHPGDNIEIISVTEEQLKSGEVAYLLQGTQDTQFWGQTLEGENRQTYPVLGGAKVYYGYDSCGDVDKVYTNDDNVSAEKSNHTLTYTASGSVITESCSKCNVTLGTATISAEDTTYDGTEQKTATVTYSEGWMGGTLTPAYENNTNAGTATATITLDEATASVNFTIDQKELTLKLTDCSKTYDGTNVLTTFNAEVEGFIFYDEGSYVQPDILDYDDIYDDVSVDESKLTVTLSGSAAGAYTTAKVSGITLIGEDAGNYTIAAEIDAVPIEGYYGDFEIYKASVTISSEDQVVAGENDIDPDAWTVNELPQGHTINNVVLQPDEDDTYILVITNSVTITDANGNDVTDCFDIYTDDSGVITRVHEGHSFDENGFCATGECDNYQSAVAGTMTDEYGNESDCYLIYNAGQLYWFAQQVNEYGNNSINGKLMADITVNTNLTAENLRTWTPIGSSYPTYNGHFDGNGKTISGLYAKSEGSYVGLFGGTDYGYQIKNIHITNSYFEGDSNVGALIGYAGTYISGCTVSDSVTVVGNSSVGGIVGSSAYGELTNCWSTATVTEGGEPGGGLVGNNYLTITNCYTTASKLVGYNSGEITNSYYLSETATEDGGKTAAQFKSGEVAYLLQSGIVGEEVWDDELEDWVVKEPAHIWGQTIGSEDYPVLDGAKVYQVTNCKDETLYSNTNENVGHSYGSPAYSWTEDPTRLTVSVACTTCGETFSDSTTQMEVITSADGFTTTYTATVTLDGKDYTDSKTVDNEVKRVNITWGTMDFTYTDEAGWNNPESAWVQVENTGNTAVTVTYTYSTERTDIKGSFFDGTATLTAPVTIDTVDNKKKVWLRLDGQPSEALSGTIIGSVKLTIE